MQGEGIDINHIITLISKSIGGTLSAEEDRLLQDWIAADTENSNLFKLLMDAAYRRQELLQMSSFTDEETALANFLAKDRENRTVKSKIRPLWYKLVAAAAIVITVGVSLYFYHNHGDSNMPQVAITADVLPGKNRATIVLGKGKMIALSEAKTGVVIAPSGLAYNDGSRVQDTSAVGEKLTVSTPRGGQYAVTLPDGSKVWLNAASTISFPSTFSGLTNRFVELHGEAYFEVAKDKRHPFIVKMARQEITVLGTHFNVNGYDNETETRTTLMEGRVKVNNTYLIPGQEAVLRGQKMTVSNVNTDKALAWKNNRFVFEEDDIESVMRVLQRWYDIEVTYLNGVPTEPFGGIISRSEPLSEVLKYLELASVATGNKVHFEIKGRRVLVTK